ncbi:MAG: ATP-binding protein [Candidatus Hodarchaeales archaeon]|jgi:ABC-type multidrug transport system ATPase subunit
MTQSLLHIGFDRKDKNEKIELPIDSFKRHFAALGSSGSGKTVLVKCVIEESIRAGIPLLIVDLQGDLASLALMGDKNLAESKGTPGSYYDEIKNKAQVAIYTPASSKGIPISMNPLKSPPPNLDHEDLIQAIDSVAETIASILKYNTEKGKGAEVKNYLYLLLEAIWDQEQSVETFGKLANFILNDDEFLDESAQAMISDKVKEDLVKNVRGLTIGAESLIFNLGIPLDVSRMMDWADKDKVPVNVLYLNTLRDQDDRVNFIANTAQQVYSWMLQNPSNDVQLVFILDELAGLVPPIRNPPSKKSIQLLLKQARKYGVSLLLATQNVSDVDYKSLGQVGTWALGRLMAKQDIEKVKDIIQSISPAETDEILNSLSKQKAGQFILLAPDVFKSVRMIQARWLVTNHITLDDSKVKAILDKSGIRDKFPDAVPSKGRKKVQKGDEETLLEVETEEVVELLPGKEIDLVEDELTVPKIKKTNDFLDVLEKKPLALSVEEMAEINNESVKKVTKAMDKLVSDKKLKVESVNGVKVYWSPKYKMDPKNNIIGPLYRMHIARPRGVAEKLMKSNIPKTLGIKSLEKIIDNETELFYCPLWRLNALVVEEKGGFMGFGSKTMRLEKSFYINGITGGVLHYDPKEKQLEFPIKGIENPQEIKTLGKEVSNLLDPEFADGLKDTDLKPDFNREDSIDQTMKLLGARINRKVVPSIVYMPIWQFTLIDKDTNHERNAWIDAVYGTYMTENPLKK